MSIWPASNSYAVGPVQPLGVLSPGEQEVRNLLEDACVAIHWVGPDGIILWANRAELEMLGYSRDEYIGHPITKFHADQPVIDEMLRRLSTGEILREYPARLRCRDGSIRNVLINSNVLWVDGKFIHTRCFTRDTAEREDSERRFREMIDALPVAIYTTDAQGRLTHFNPAAAEFSGRKPELGSDQWCVTWKLYYPDGTPMPHDQCPMAVALKEGRVLRDVEAIAERPDGKRIWFTPYPTALRDANGRIVGGINMLLDITERKRAEETRARLAAIVESSEDAIVSKDLNGIITTWNEGAERLFGYTAQEVVGKSVTILMPPERFNEEMGILERIRHGESIEHYETVRRRKDGTLLDVSLTVSPVVDGNQKIIGASKIARDITPRKRMEEELAKWRMTLESRVAEQTRQLQAEGVERKRLEAEVAGAAEAEQERLGQELHDGLGQELTGIAMMLDVLKMKLMKAAPKQASEAQRLEMMLRGSADKARQLAKGFYPVEIEKYGLLVALQELARRNQERFGMSCTVQAGKDAPAGLQDGRAIQLYRIAQEALHNAAKHAKAKNIFVSLTTQNGAWMLTVKDDGIGLPSDAHAAKGMGLRIMHYRAHMIGGTLSVRNDDGGGVIVSCSTPASQMDD